eukprot:30545-Pelagococcus_subviridis.AAC.3
MRPRLRLLLDERVKLGVVQHDRVRGREVQPQPARARGHEHQELMAALRVEAVDDSLSLRAHRPPANASVLWVKRSVRTACTTRTGSYGKQSHRADDPRRSRLVVVAVRVRARAGPEERVVRRASSRDGRESHAGRPEPVLDDVEHARHLAEEQHSMAAAFQLWKKLREELHLSAGRSEQVRLQGRRLRWRRVRVRRRVGFRPRLGVFQLRGRRGGDLLRQPRLASRLERVFFRRREEKRVVAHLLQLLEDVHQVRALRHVRALVERRVVPREDVRTLQDVAFQPTEHVVPEKVVQVFELRVRGSLRFLFRERVVGVGGVGVGVVVVRAQIALAAVAVAAACFVRFGDDAAPPSPPLLLLRFLLPPHELLRFVLERLRERRRVFELLRRRPREQTAEIRLHPFERLGELRVVVFQPVAFVHDDAAPLHLPQNPAVRQREVVRREQNVHVRAVRRALAPELIPRKLAFALRRPRRLIPHVRNRVQRRAPQTQLRGPVRYGDERHDHEHRLPAREPERARGVDERRRLDRLPQAHLIAENRALPELELGEHPLHALALVPVEGQTRRDRTGRVPGRRVRERRLLRELRRVRADADARGAREQRVDFFVEDDGRAWFAGLAPRLLRRVLSRRARSERRELERELLRDAQVRRCRERREFLRAALREVHRRRLLRRDDHLVVVAAAAAAARAAEPPLRPRALLHLLRAHRVLARVRERLPRALVVP